MGTREGERRTMRGYYQTSEVDRIEREVVTEAMVDWALRVNYMNSGRRQGLRNKSNEEWLRNPARRAHARRNIAIGIQAGSYSVAVFEAEQALWCLAPVKA